MELFWHISICRVLRVLVVSPAASVHKTKQLVFCSYEVSLCWPADIEKLKDTCFLLNKSIVLLDRILWLWLPPPWFTVCRIKQRVLPNAVGTITVQSVNHLQKLRSDKSETIYRNKELTKSINPHKTHSKLGRYPSALAQWFDMWNVPSQSPVYAAAFVTDQNPFIYRSPSRIWQMIRNFYNGQATKQKALSASPRISTCCVWKKQHCDSHSWRPKLTEDSAVSTSINNTAP